MLHGPAFPGTGSAAAHFAALPFAWLVLASGAFAGVAPQGQAADGHDDGSAQVATRSAPAATAAAKATPKPNEREAAKGLDRVPTATPPGTALIPTLQKVPVGTPLNRVIELIRRHPAQRGSIAAEGPQQRVRVESFHLMVNQVTNEQYLAFVQATGHRPPDHWAEPAIEAGRRATLEAEGAARRKAMDAGEPVPERQPFVSQEWWERNWRESEWAMPPRLANVPVTMVGYQDAVAYARWAGMRLMSEAEYHAAARGEDGNRDYPWGNQWEAQRAATAMGQQALPVPVGRYRLGVSAQGVHDLIGNVWEWTASPYSPLPGFKPIPARDIDPKDKEGETITASFNPDARVVVGGSVKQDATEVRVGIRMRAARFQRTEVLGFRCAATPKPGFDRAQTIEGRTHFGDAELAYQRMLAIDRWYTEPGTGDVRSADDAANLYAVVTAYEHVLAVPPDRIAATSLPKLNEDSTATPVPIALFSTSLPVASPKLEPGEYLVSYRAAGKERKPTSRAGQGAAQEESAAATALDALIDPTVPNFVFSALDGTPIAALRAGPARYEVPPRDAPNGKLAVVRGGDKPDEHDAVVMTLVIPARQSNAFLFDLRLGYEAGSLAGPWRR